MESEKENERNPTEKKKKRKNDNNLKHGGNMKRVRVCLRDWPR